MTEIDSNWSLWRQDDNGSSTVIERNLDRSEANLRLKELEARGHKQHYWIEREEETKSPNLNLVVIRSKDIELAKAFYESIGLEFDRHKHGAGAEHFACEAASYVFEIYPATDQTSSGARLGFAVPAVDNTIEQLRSAGYEIVSEPKTSPWGRRAVVRDPDGHSVELVTTPQAISS